MRKFILMQNISFLKKFIPLIDTISIKKKIKVGGKRNEKNIPNFDSNSFSNELYFNLWY